MDKIEKEFDFNETFPKKIFLQPGQLWEGVEITIWSPYANEEHNVEYVRKDVHKKLLKANEKEVLDRVEKEMRMEERHHVGSFLRKKAKGLTSQESYELGRQDEHNERAFNQNKKLDNLLKDHGVKQ